jgi:RHS repeat-associated protein
VAGFKTTAYHSMGPSQQPTTNWMGSLIGGQRDPGGTMYMRNRYYDPQTGQFTQTDPIGIGGGLNTYGFAAGDPVGNWDPFGTCAWGIGPDAAHGRCLEEDPYPRDEWGTTPECDTAHCNDLDEAKEGWLIIGGINDIALVDQCWNNLDATTTGTQVVPTSSGPKTIETVQWYMHPLVRVRRWLIFGPTEEVRFRGTAYVRRGTYRTGLPLRAAGWANCNTGDAVLEAYGP